MWPWDDLRDDMVEVKNLGAINIEWSTGVTKRIIKGDRAFSMRLGEEPKGIMASGIFTGSPEWGLSWNDKTHKQALYAPVELDVILSKDQVLPLGSLSRRFSEVRWTPQASGQSISPPVALKLEKLWTQWLTKQKVQPKPLLEGALKRIISDQRERNPEARRQCIEHYGFECSICEFNLGNTYGEVGKGLIHVHHLKPLSKTTGTHIVNPIEDLRPVCANCHAVIHRQSTALTIEEMQAIIQENKS